ncbi:hypothetical protein AOQ84DRAFT_153392 [Glonium stellatum]|uniref:Uncharacterized protein n=1 Tax=Glonium stellatum TaxID=574774 RepID=A0A8E2JN70_9PEZI|nr:hypothetical protein AOQ84DRAFT_153392 [Glonium stellatum]
MLPQLYFSPIQRLPPAYQARRIATLQSCRYSARLLDPTGGMPRLKRRRSSDHQSFNQPPRLASPRLVAAGTPLLSPLRNRIGCSFSSPVSPDPARSLSASSSSSSSLVCETTRDLDLNPRPQLPQPAQLRLVPSLSVPVFLSRAELRASGK